MSALLRCPNIVPSLFSACDDQPDPMSDRAHPSRGFAERLEACFLVIDGKPGEPVMGAFGRALAGTCIALVLVGKPLMIAGLLVVGKALAH